MGRMAGRPMVDGWPVASRQSPVASSGTQTQDPGRESGRGVWVSPCEDGRYGTKCVCGMGGMALAGEEQEETAVLSWWWWFWWFCGLERREWLGGWVDGSGGWTGGARWETSAWGTSGVIQKGTGSPGSPGSRPLATQPGQLQRRGTIPYLPGQGGWGGATGGRIAGAGWLDGQWPMGKVGQQAGVRGVSVCPRVCECVTVQVCVCACVRACVRVLVFVHVLLLL